MKKYEQQIQNYRETVQTQCIREAAEKRTISACQNVLQQQNLGQPASYFEFLYEQSYFIRKRWWLLQGILLFFLWLWLGNETADIVYTMRVVGIFATVFVILIFPEIWKNRRNAAIEIEQSAYYTLRQICTARMVLFAAVDFFIVMLFFLAACATAAIGLHDLMINFLLPVNVSCCICFRFLYSRWSESEYLAVFFCLVWVGVWTMLVTNDAVYQRIASPVWAAMLVLTFAYFIFCVRKSLAFDERILEENRDGIRI